MVFASTCIVKKKAIFAKDPVAQIERGEGSLAAQTRGYSCTWRFDLAGGRDCGWRLIPRLREMLICFAHRHNWRLAICLYGLSRSSHGLAAAVCVQWQPNQDARLGGERRALLRMLSFFTPHCMPRHFRHVRGVNEAVAYMAAHGSTPRHFPWILPFPLKRRDSLLPINHQGNAVRRPPKSPLSLI